MIHFVCNSGRWCSSSIAACGRYQFKTGSLHMNINTFLKELVQSKPEFTPTPEDKKTIEFEGIEKFIYNKLNSSIYKASSITPDYLVKIKDKIHLCINHEVPIHVSIPFGSVKVSTLPTAPGIDWAEVFNLTLVREYLTPIAKMYKYGVKLDYISVAIFEEEMNYFSQKDIALYETEFKKLVDIFCTYLPDNFEINFIRVADLVPKEKTLRMINIKVDELRNNWMKNSEEVRNTKIMRAKRNCCLKPTDKDYDKRILRSIFVHDAFCSECWTLDYAPWDKKDMITLGYRYTDGWAVHIRSARASTVNFWSGMGALLKNNDILIPTILSFKQYESHKKNIQMEKVDVFNQSFKNLSQVPVVNQ